MEVVGGQSANVEIDATGIRDLSSPVLAQCRSSGDSTYDFLEKKTISARMIAMRTSWGPVRFLGFQGRYDITVLQDVGALVRVESGEAGSVGEDVCEC